MRLISCYIEGYGKIKRKEYRFEEGITTLLGENGEGKSTLASFLKAMFYGLKAYRKDSTEFCDREHYYPFDGGAFGGNLTFETGGKICKIERFFGEKSDTADSLKYYENGEEIPAVADLGKSIFGVDRESFERTTFLDGKFGEIKSTSGIRARLNNFLEGGEEDGDADDAKKALERAAKVYKKSRIGNDKVSEATRRIAQLNERIDNAEAIKKSLEEKYRRLATLRGEIEEINARIVEGQTLNEKRSQQEHYDSLQEGVQKAKNELQAVLQKYPVGLPTAEETAAVNEYMGRSNALKAKLDGMEISQSDRQRAGELERLFARGIPAEEKLLELEGEMKTLSDLQAESKLLEGKRATEEERELQVKFAHGTPSEKVLSETQAKVQAYQKVKAAYEQTPAWLSESGKQTSVSGKKYALFALIAILLIAVGGVLLAYNALGGGVMAIGGVLLLADGFLYLNKKSSVGQGTPTENSEKRRLEEELRGVEDAIKGVLMPYGYYSGNGVVFDFAHLQSDVAAYRRYAQERESRQEKIAQNGGRIEELSGCMTAFFRGYGLAGDTFVKLLSDLRVKINDYLGLKTRFQQTGEERASVERELAQLRSQIELYRGKYALKELSVGLIAEDIRSAERLKREIAEGEERAALYCEEKGLQAQAAVEKIDLAQLQETLTEKQNERSKLEREIAADETEAEKLEGYAVEKLQAEGLKKEYEQKHRLLNAALREIERAEGSLLDKYVKPIKEEFLRNAEPIEGVLGEKLVMTKNFELRFERNGKERSEKHLSAGQRSICDLCFRLSLVKNMYREQLPFLILDDPFTSLDEGHMRKVAALLREWAKEVQIIYFTCHSSRGI